MSSKSSDRSIAVYLRTQDVIAEVPAYNCTETLAVLIASSYPRLAMLERSTRRLHILTDVSFRELKGRVRAWKACDKLNAPDYHVPNCLSYPGTRQNANGKAEQREMWMRATKFGPEITASLQSKELHVE